MSSIINRFLPNIKSKLNRTPTASPNTSFESSNNSSISSFGTDSYSDLTDNNDIDANDTTANDMTANDVVVNEMNGDNSDGIVTSPDVEQSDSLTTYLDNVTINSNNSEMLKQTLLRQLPSETDMRNMCDAIKTTTMSQQGWINCGKPTCFNICSQNVLKEINSTAYYLRTITASLLQIQQQGQDEYSVSFQVINPENITGLWNNDYSNLILQINQGENEIDSTSIPNGRLIMGFGPSASGKTYCAKQIIYLMTMVDGSFPKYFLSIDGGIYREECLTYQTILDCIRANNSQVKGFNNLVSTNAFTSSIFDSNIVKAKINGYLKYLKEQKNIKMNLYVPDTLSVCMPSCNSIYGKYIYLTGDNNWIGTLIWQHMYGGMQCSYGTKYGEQFQCKGCTESGQEREIKEGKKYSNSAWNSSYKNGRLSMMKAPNYRFFIHNSGSHENWSIVKDYSRVPVSENVIFYLEKINWRYIDHTGVNRSSFSFLGGKAKYHTQKCKKINRKITKKYKNLNKILNKNLNHKFTKKHKSLNKKTNKETNKKTIKK